MHRRKSSAVARMQTQIYTEYVVIILPEKTIKKESHMTENVNIAKLISRASLKLAGRDRALNAMTAQIIAKNQLYNRTAVWRSLADSPQSIGTVASWTTVFTCIGFLSRNTAMRITSKTTITITIKN
jgi:hypothetical protein